MIKAALVVTAGVIAIATACAAEREPAKLPPVARNQLREAATFSVITDRGERSRALFLEASRVLLHPRCSNCHPNGDVPLQGIDRQLHQPPVVRGPENYGVVGMECPGCHQDRNLEQARVPGAPNWHLAPREMAWVGQTPRHICEQMKDSSRNGGKSLAQIVEHNAHDELVGWGWHPGHDREPAPGTQAQFGALIEAWVKTGAECPSEGDKP
jgi:hypothetical protein